MVAATDFITLYIKFQQLTINPCKLITRSTANAVERPSPVHLLRAAVTRISENPEFQFEVVDDPLNISTCYLAQLQRSVKGISTLDFVRMRYVDSEIWACVLENIFALYRRSELEP